VSLYALQPVAFRRLTKHARPSSWTSSTQPPEDFQENAPVLESQLHRHRQGPSTRDLGTGGTVSTQTVGEVKAEMRAARDSHMPAELPRQTAPIHHF